MNNKIGFLWYLTVHVLIPHCLLYKVHYILLICIYSLLSLDKVSLLIPSKFSFLNLVLYYILSAFTVSFRLILHINCLPFNPYCYSNMKGKEKHNQILCRNIQTMVCIWRLALRKFLPCPLQDKTKHQLLYNTKLHHYKLLLIADLRTHKAQWNQLFKATVQINR